MIINIYTNIYIYPYILKKSLGFFLLWWYFVLYKADSLFFFFEHFYFFKKMLKEKLVGRQATDLMPSTLVL